MKIPHFNRYIVFGVLFTLMGAAILVQMARIQNSEVAAELLQQAG